MKRTVRYQREDHKSAYVVRDYLILAVVIFISSFKSAVLSSEYGDLFVAGLPPYISLPQTYANYLIILLMMLSIVLKKDTTRKLEKKSALLAFGIFQFMIAVVTQEQGWIVKSISVLIVLVYFMLVVSNMYFYKNNYRLDNAVNAMYYGTALFCIYNVFVYLLIPDLVTWKGRVFGVTMHPNFLGVAAALAFILAFYKACYTNDRSRIFRLFNFLSIGVSLFVVYLSDSRTALGLCFLGIAYFVSLKIKSYLLKTVLLLGCTIAALLFYTTYMQGSVNTEDLGGRGFNRETTWVQLWEDVLNPTLFGLGKVGATANSYLFAIVATGVVGGIFFYYAIINIIMKIRQNEVRPQVFYNVLAIGLLSSAILEGFLLDAISIPVFTCWILISFSTMKSKLTKAIWKKESPI